MVSRIVHSFGFGLIGLNLTSGSLPLIHSSSESCDSLGLLPGTKSAVSYIRICA